MTDLEKIIIIKQILEIRQKNTRIIRWDHYYHGHNI
jgi:hypothetical protein